MAIELAALEIAQVHPAQGDAPLARVEEAQQQPGQSRFAGPGGADDGGDRARGQGDGQLAEHRGLVVVAVAHLLEAQGVVDRLQTGAGGGLR